MFGATLGLAFTALVALTADAAPREQRGLALGMYNSCLYLGMMLSSALMGLVIRFYGFSVAFYLCGGISLLVAVLFSLLYHKSENMEPVSTACGAGQ